MKSNFAKYVEEREGKHIVEDQNGFATYEFYEDVVYIEDLYVIPEKREFGIASHYADQITKEALSRGCVKMLGSVSINDPGKTRNLKVLFAYGFSLSHLSNDMIYLSKQIGDNNG